MFLNDSWCRRLCSGIAAHLFFLLRVFLFLPLKRVRVADSACGELRSVRELMNTPSLPLFLLLLLLFVNLSRLIQRTPGDFYQTGSRQAGLRVQPRTIPGARYVGTGTLEHGNVHVVARKGNSLVELVL